MRISDWSSDVCSSDLGRLNVGRALAHRRIPRSFETQHTVPEVHHINTVTLNLFQLAPFRTGNHWITRAPPPRRRPGSSYDRPDAGPRPSPGRRMEEIGRAHA